jgi:hypothetical protein
LVGGVMRLSNETDDIRFFSIGEALEMDLFHSHVLRLRDALTMQEAAFIR